MLAAKHDFTIERGGVFTRSIQWKDTDGNSQDLTDYTAAMDIRPSWLSLVVIKRLSTDDGSISLGANGLITLNLNADDTKALTGYMKGVYTLEMYPAGLTVNAIRLLEGFVFFSNEVTE